MHYTLHLTDACNMACKYCYVRPGVKYMQESTARAAIDAAAREGGSRGIIFFGGEPLLCKPLLYATVAYARRAEAKGNVRFHFKVTTNGLLMDDDFLDYAQQNGVFIALSHDGTEPAHNSTRVDAAGKGTFARLEGRIDALLGRMPYAPVLMTVDPGNVAHYAAGVEYLYAKGFKYLICSLNYAGAWNEKTMAELRRQYRRLAIFYEEHTLAEDKFYLSPFEVKIQSHIMGKDYCAERCELGMRQLSLGPDGRLYPCVQFVGDDSYALGSIHGGIDEQKRRALYRRNEEERGVCAACAIKSRCNHHCACLNRQVTGGIDNVAPSLCAHERILLPIADALAKRLYEKRSGLFIQKQYNEFFPLLSLLEDKPTGSIP